MDYGGCEAPGVVIETLEWPEMGAAYENFWCQVVFWNGKHVISSSILGDFPFVICFDFLIFVMGFMVVVELLVGSLRRWDGRKWALPRRNFRRQVL